LFHPAAVAVIGAACLHPAGRSRVPPAPDPSRL